MRYVITGGAGFVGSHLCEALIARGDEVVCVDNLSTGLYANIQHLEEVDRFNYVEGDVSVLLDIPGPVTAIAHLASPASPPEYLRMPLQTLAVGSRGSENVLDLARRKECRAILASTSEIYGDPQIHPQPETYWGNVNPIGPRSVYDESKRFAEAVFTAYRRSLGVDTGIVRIFNTYGPRLRPQDGRVVSNFIAQALQREPLTVYGTGNQTRSFCYVDDLVQGLVRMLDSDEAGPINLGNTAEVTVGELAELVLELTGSDSSVVYEPLPQDDPTCRRPDLAAARAQLGWSPAVSLRAGLESTIRWQRSLLPELVTSQPAFLSA
ncbi:MAG TPA: UDP-glucuronic acid decarboxylase family protein [Mycobacteriales bacterium]|nr:UDP-glucuronic acid decarboxylase family protein [Mycobacteriales bacterium]